MLSSWFNDGHDLVASDVSWEDLISQASSQYLLPALGQQCRKRGIEKQVPEDVLTLFRSTESLNAERNQAIMADAGHAAALLNKVGIQPVALKGVAYLLTSVYQNQATRYLLDIDLLIPADQLRKAFECLTQNGYFQSESATFLEFRHHYPSVRRKHSASIELHKQVILGAYNRLLPASSIVAKSRPVRLNGATILVPSPTDLVNHLLLHSQLHHSYNERIFPPLRALIDLTQLQNRFSDEIDWQALAKTYRDNGEFGTITLHLHHAHELLGFPIPPPIPTTLPFFLRLRYKRRQLLNRNPKLRFLDPAYLAMTLFSRRLRLLPLMLKSPSSWPQLLTLLTRRDFYQNLLR